MNQLDCRSKLKTGLTSLAYTTHTRTAHTKSGNGKEVGVGIGSIHYFDPKKNVSISLLVRSFLTTFSHSLMLENFFLMILKIKELKTRYKRLWRLYSFHCDTHSLLLRAAQTC